MSGALDGITVLDLTRGKGGAMATMFLCDNGARVIRIGTPDADPDSAGPGYRTWNRGKESIHLDLDSPDGLRALYKLVARADVVVDTLAPSSPSQNTVGYTRLAPLNPRLVHCSITAYGPTGPLKDEPPIDDLVMARIGTQSLIPSFRPGPPHLAIPVPSIGAGLLAAQGIVAALFDRERSGAGRRVETSLMAGALAMSPKASNYAFPANLRPRRPTGTNPFYSSYRCADGVFIQMSCIHRRFAENAADILQVRERITHPRFGDWRLVPTQEAADELFGILADAFAARTYKQWADLFEKGDVPYGRVNNVARGMRDPQVRFNKLVIDIDDPEIGTITQMGLLTRLLGTPGEVRGPAPIAGQHTAQVLSEVAGEDYVDPSPRETAVAPTNSPLTGVRVLEIANVIAGPMACRYLVDLGAEVIKLEPPQGDISRPTGRRVFFCYNLGKRSLSLNARTEEGMQIARRLGLQADVILENMRPGAANRIGLDYDDLKRQSPGLVFTHLTAYGSNGPYAHRPGLDPVAQALVGVAWTQGDGKTPVQMDVLAPVDYTASMLGALGTLLALFARERNGVGQEVETSLLAAAVMLVSEHFTRYPGKPPRRPTGKGQYGPGTAHRLYQTSDGWLYLAADGRDQWAALLKLIDADGAGKVTSRRLEKAFSEHTTDEWLTRLKKSGVPCAPVRYDYDTMFFTDPQALANDMVVQLEHPSLGEMQISRNLVRFPNTDYPVHRPTPLLGEHSREVLRELGYSTERIDALYESGVIVTEKPNAKSGK